MRRLVGLLILIGNSLWTQAAPDRPVFAHVPEEKRPRPNPLANDHDAPIAGAKLFEQHCSQCHGTAGEGGRGGPRLIGAEMRHATPGEIFWVITNGVVRHGMPSWSKLPPAQRWQIVAFLSALNPPHKPR